MIKIDLNADVGEGYDDAALIPFVSSVNIACGAHAGNGALMHHVVELALHHQVAIGAHPGYPDREHFGRKPWQVTPEHVAALVSAQVQALQVIAGKHGARVQHVKPHGALYHQACTDPRIAAAVVKAVADADPHLILMGLPGSILLTAGQAAHLRTAAEGFVDRAYRRDGSLVPRDMPRAVHAETQASVAQALALARGDRIMSHDGAWLKLQVASLCLHGDTAQAALTAQAVRQALDAAGIAVTAIA